mmetsp:Transcript_20293/g.32759  ORF Transcript_20293/g.32759 Transcript_20293/m.32759 type:complete len:121 (-) Transcript_20293:1152-1514(-)
MKFLIIFIQAVLLHLSLAFLPASHNMQQQSPQLSFPHPVARKTSGGLKMAIPSYMQDKLKGIEQTFNQLTNSLADPDVLNDSKQLMKISKERSKLEEIVEAFQEYKSREADLTGAKELFF